METSRDGLSLPEGAKLATVLASADGALADGVDKHVATLLGLAEAAVETFLRAHGETPTNGRVEGFRLLALHRQGARLDQTYLACRESCRELIFQCNMARAHPAEAARRLRMAALVCRHVLLFTAGKLETAALGTFCCAARPLRAAEAP